MKKIQFDIYPDGTQCWYLNGDLHREDGPAKIFLDGSQFWYLNDMFIKGNRDEEDSV